MPCARPKAQRLIEMTKDGFWFWCWASSAPGLDVDAEVPTYANRRAYSVAKMERVAAYRGERIENFGL
ncbi:hypothetical protein DIE23_21655 [Burkholderia sp. Bp9143]|nr:hypothetical protein DIE23_21655 [Burkholderia sp. Bp9143]